MTQPLRHILYDEFLARSRLKAAMPKQLTTVTIDPNRKSLQLFTQSELTRMQYITPSRLVISLISVNGKGGASAVGVTGSPLTKLVI
jgi:hypothetical protein